MPPLVASVIVPVKSSVLPAATSMEAPRTPDSARSERRHGTSGKSYSSHANVPSRTAIRDQGGASVYNDRFLLRAIPSEQGIGAGAQRGTAIHRNAACVTQSPVVS